MGVSSRDMFRYNVDIEIARDQNILVQVHPRLKLNLLSCRARHGDILRARDRLQPPTEPLTASRGAWTHYSRFGPFLVGKFVFYIS